MSTTPLRSSCLCLSNGSILWTWTGWALVLFCGTLLALEVFCGTIVVPVLFSLAKPPLSLFPGACQGVSPVHNSCSQTIAHSRTALILGLSRGWVLVGGWTPPHPHSLILQGMVSRNYCLLWWATWCKDVGGHFSQCRDSSMWCCLPKKWVDQDWLLI